MTVSQCGKYLVAGGFDCKVRVFLAHSLERNYVYEAFTSSIRSLHFSHDQRWVRKSFGRLALHLTPPPSLSYLYLLPLSPISILTGTSLLDCHRAVLQF